MREVHSIDRCNQRWRHQYYRDNGENLDDLVLLEVDEPERGIEQEIGLVREKGGLVRERHRVAVQRLDARPHLLLGPLVVGLAGGVIAEEAVDADQALAQLGEEVAVRADLLDGGGKVALLARAAVLGLMPE